MPVLAVLRGSLNSLPWYSLFIICKLNSTAGDGIEEEPVKPRKVAIDLGMAWRQQAECQLKLHEAEGPDRSATCLGVARASEKVELWVPQICPGVPQPSTSDSLLKRPPDQLQRGLPTERAAHKQGSQPRSHSQKPLGEQAPHRKQADTPKKTGVHATWEKSNIKEVKTQKRTLLSATEQHEVSSLDIQTAGGGGGGTGCRGAPGAQPVKRGPTACNAHQGLPRAPP